MFSDCLGVSRVAKIQFTVYGVVYVYGYGSTQTLWDPRDSKTVLGGTVNVGGGEYEPTRLGGEVSVQLAIYAANIRNVREKCKCKSQSIAALICSRKI